MKIALSLWGMERKPGDAVTAGVSQNPCPLQRSSNAVTTGLSSTRRRLANFAVLCPRRVVSFNHQAREHQNRA